MSLSPEGGDHLAIHTTYPAAPWTTIPGYQAGYWDDFRPDLEHLHPDTTALSRLTKQNLKTFRKLSAKSRVRSEADVLKYYRNFLTIATPLLSNNRITIDDFNTAFFKGFHRSIRDIIAKRFRVVYPHHPVREPFHVQGVLDAVCRHFAPDHFHRPAKSQKGKSHDKHRGRGHAKRRYDSPDAFIQRRYGATHSHKNRRAHSEDSVSDSGSNSDSSSDSGSDSEENSDTSSEEYKTKIVRFKRSRSSKTRGKEDDDPLSLLTKVQSLSIHEPSYLILYAQLQKRFPMIVQYLPKPQPQLLPAASSASVGYQLNPAVTGTQPFQSHLHQQPHLSAPPPIPTPVLTSTPAAADAKTDYFRAKYSAQARGCAFCSYLGHRIYSCSVAEEYVDTGRVKVINRRLYLPTGHPIPNDGRGLGLKAGVDAWLAANKQYSSTSTATTVQYDPPPHTASLSSEVLTGSAAFTGVCVTEADADSDTGNSDDHPNEQYNMSEVSETRKTDPAPSRVPAPNTPSPTPTASTSTFAPPAHDACATQYRYEASAEDQALTKQVVDWIFDGNLDQITPAHILASSPAIRKNFAERLSPRHVETGSSEQVSNDSADPVPVSGLAAKREAEFSPSLREVDVLVNDLRTESGVLDQGSQLVVIREDLAKEVGARINTQRTLRIKDANGSTYRTLGCAEDLGIRIGDMSFDIQAHVIRTAPFRLLLGRPFHHLLLCRLQDHPDHVDMFIRDPANPRLGKTSSLGQTQQIPKSTGILEPSRWWYSVTAEGTVPEPPSLAKPVEEEC